MIVRRRTYQLDIIYMPLPAMLISLRSRYFRPSSVLESLPWLAERSIIGKKISSHSSASKFSLQSESSAKTTGLFLAF